MRDTKSAHAHFIGTSAIMRAVYRVIESAAGSKAPVFITGESGTGKDVCAQTIHALSPRRASPFIAVNCAAIPSGLLESALFGHTKGAFTGASDHHEGAVARAEGGTLFLDEIAEMDMTMQSKLLRFVQTLSYMKVGGTRETKVDIRIVCATNRDPETEIAAGRLRADLFYRLHVVPIEMPPLRGRESDILDLADYFLRLYATEEKKRFQRFSPAAEDILLSHSWPGNVRELQNMIRSLTVLHDGVEVTPAMLALKSLATAPASFPHPDSGVNVPTTPLWQVEKAAIENAIRLCGGNIPRAAALLEVAPSTIYRKKLSWEDKI